MGSEPQPQTERDADAGLFGPGSVTWAVHADPLMGLAGLRALLLQATHPVATAAFHQHSRYRVDPWGRLGRTATYVGVTTFGTRAEAMLAGARIRAVHARITGVSEDGVAYRADDPQLLLWVHCCLVDSFLDVVGRGGLALSGAQRDAYLAEQVRWATLVGLEPQDVPADRMQLTAYFRQVRPQLRVTQAARQAAGVLVAPPMRPAIALAARPAWASVAGLAFAALPPWARRLYALGDLPGTASAEPGRDHRGPARAAFHPPRSAGGGAVAAGGPAPAGCPGAAGGHGPDPLTNARTASATSWTAIADSSSPAIRVTRVTPLSRSTRWITVANRSVR